MRELGKRYANAFLKLAATSFIPRKGSVAVSEPKAPTAVFAAAVRLWTGNTKIYSLDGRAITVITTPNKRNAWRVMKPGNVYLVTRKSGNNARLMVVP